MNPIDALMALLFATDTPVTVGQLALVLGHTEGQVEQSLDILKERLNASGPLQVVEIAGGFQLATKPEFAEIVGNLLQPQRGRLSKSIMEVLAIVAYRQPITVAEIDAVRGVQSDYSLKSLLERRLVREVGRKQTPGRPILYGTTDQFLHQFNLVSLEQLPATDIGVPALPAPGESNDIGYTPVQG